MSADKNNDGERAPREIQGQRASRDDFARMTTGLVRHANKDQVGKKSWRIATSFFV